MEMFHLIDIIQVITDSAAVGLKIQGYTKVNEYAKAVKDTGEKLNRSLIPAGDLGYHIENGKVVLDYDTVEGIDINHPDFFDSTDNPDVGNIVIGINETQIRAAMVSDFIDYIIPFHTGQSKEVLGEKGIAEWQNYKDSQSERDITTNKKSAHQINIYTEVIAAAEKEGKPIKNKVDFVNKFLEVCRENGLKPRFAEFLNTNENGEYVYTEGYHKFLVDFKTFDSRTGEYLPQKPVKPLFDNKYITGLLENYAESQKAKDAELAKSMPKVIKRITNEVVKTEAKWSGRNNRKPSYNEWDVLSALYDALDHEDKGYDHLIKIGTMPNYIADKLGIDGDFYIYRNHIYENMVSDNQAKEDSRYVEGRHYHDLGFDITAAAIMSLENPILSIATQTKKNNPAVAMILPVKGKNGIPLYSVMSLYSSMSVNGDFSTKPHVVLSIYETDMVKESNDEAKKSRNKSLEEIVEQAVKDGKVIDLDKKTRDALSVIAERTGLGNVTEASLANSLAQFRKEIKTFKEKNKISYSERNTDSNRSLLANALETTVQNDIEANKLKEYKEKIALIDAEQQKLAEINAQIKELSFSKGERDTAKLKSLRFDAVQAANRINTFDRQLLNLESTKVLKRVLEREKGLARKKQKQKNAEVLKDYRDRYEARLLEQRQKNAESRQKASMGRRKTEMRHKIKRVVSDLNQLLLRPTKDKHVMIGLQKATADALSAVNMETGIGLGKNFAELRVAYEDIKNSDDPLMANAYEEGIKDRIDNLRTSVGDTAIMDMSLEQLEEVYDTFKIVLTTIRNADKSFKAKKGESISILGNRAMEEILTVGGSKDRSVKALEGIKSFAWNGLKPSYAMDMIGSAVLSEMFDNVRAGEDTWARDVSEAREFYRTTAEKHGYDSWNTEESHSFVVGGGKTVALSLDQMMSLYAYSKRKQADKHLELGGFVFDDAIEVTEKVKGVPVKYKVKTATAHKLSKDELATIIGKLIPEQRAFVDEMQDYLSTVMGEKGNEVSLEMYGVKLFKEKHYFPLKSAKQFMFEQNEVSGEVKLKNSGFSKETVVNANNPIILSNFMDVWSGHVNDMSMYHSFVLPLEDFNRVFNYRTPTSDNYDTESVKMYLQNAYGNQPAQYIKQMLTDLNGGARMDTTAGIVNKGLALFKKGAVFASASVVVQQPSALVRAMASVNPKYFIGSLNLKNHKKTWEEVKKYAPVAIIKEMGYFDTNMGMQTTEWISQTEYKGFGSKAKGFFVDSDYRDEVLSKAPALADELTWAYIWSAVKREVAATTKFPASSEAFLKKAGERFTEVIVDTQVYDSVLSRSAMMRSKDTGMKMATAFMAEPTTSINMIANALVQGKRGNVAYARNAIGAVVGSMILNSILVSLVYAARDDDEDKTYAEKYVSTLAAEVIDSLNPLDLIPFVKDIVSIVRGYDVERSDMAVISDLWSAFEDLSSDNKSSYDKVKGFVGAVTQVFGLPIKNIWRDAEAMYNVVSSATSGQKTTGAGIWTAVRETVTGKDISNADELMEAMVKGDEAHAERVKARFENEDKTNSALKAAIKKKYKDGKLDATETEQYLKDFLGMTEEEIHWQMDEWGYAIENGSSEGYAKYGDFYTAVETGKDLKAVIKEYTDNGVEEKTLASRITAYYKPKYKEMSNVERAKLKGYLLNAYVLLGYNRSKKSKDIDEWLED